MIDLERQKRERSFFSKTSVRAQVSRGKQVPSSEAVFDDVNEEDMVLALEAVEENQPPQSHQPHQQVINS